jgi:hypothetical protein
MRKAKKKAFSSPEEPETGFYSAGAGGFANSPPAPSPTGGVEPEPETDEAPEE